MTTAADHLLADILAHPEDDTPRLIYADWLDEHGENERAEFIRVQVALARLVHNPTVERHNSPLCSRAELLKRGEDLLNAHYRRWNPLPQDLLVSLSHARWRRGFIERAELPGDTWVKYADALLALHPIREVTLTEGITIKQHHDDRLDSSSLAEESRHRLRVPTFIARDGKMVLDGKSIAEQLLRLNWPCVQKWHLPSRPVTVKESIHIPAEWIVPGALP